MNIVGPVKVSLAKALKVKARLTGRLVKVNSDIYQNNSKLDGQDRLNVQALIEARKELIDAMIELKLAIYRGNLPLQERLFVLAEKKSEIAFYTGLNTKDGTEMHGYQNTPVKFTATVKKVEADFIVKGLESEIDALQEEVDQFNYSTKIEISQKVLNLAS